MSECGRRGDARQRRKRSDVPDPAHKPRAVNASQDKANEIDRPERADLKGAKSLDLSTYR